MPANNAGLQVATSKFYIGVTSVNIVGGLDARAFACEKNKTAERGI